MASYKLTKNVDLQLNVQNLTDKTYYDKAYASHFANQAAGPEQAVAMAAISGLHNHAAGHDRISLLAWRRPLAWPLNTSTAS